MSLLQETQIQTSVYICSFQCFIRQANIAMKFPCSYFVEWRTVNSKISVRSQRHNPNQNLVNFDEKVNLSLEMLYDHNKLQFLSRDTIVELFIISKRMPDQHKLVGRVNIDVGKVINVGMYESPTEFKLNFCSLEGTLIMQFKACQQKLTNLTINDLDKSSFIDFMSQKALRNQSMIHSRYENQGQEGRSLEKPVRSQIRAVSPSSPKSIIRQSVFVKTNSVIVEVNKKQNTFSQELKSKQSKISNKSNDESQAKSKIGFRSNRLNRLKTEESDFDRQNKVQQQVTFLTHQTNNNMLNINQYEQKQQMVNMNKGSAVSPNSQNIKLSTNNFREVRTVKDQIITFKNAVSFQEKDQILTSLSQDNKKTKEQYMSILNQNSQLHSLIDDKQKIIIELSTKLKEQSSKYQNCLEQLTQKNTIMEQFDKELANRDLTIKNLQFEATKSKIIASENEALKRRIATLQAFSKDLKLQISQYEQKLTNYTAKISNYQFEIKSLQRDHQQCLKKINQNIKIEQSMKKKVQQLQIQNNQLIFHFQQAQTQIGQLKNNQQHPQLQGELQNMHDNLETLRVRCEKAEKQASQIQTKYFQLQSQNDVLQAENRALQEKLDNNQQNQQTSQILQEIMVSSTPNIKLQNPNNTQGIKKQNECLSRQVQFLRANCETVQRENSSLRDQNQSIKQQMLSYQHKLLALEQINNQLLQAKSLNQELSQENNSLKAQLSQMNQWKDQSNKNQQYIKELLSQNEYLSQQSRSIEGQIQFYQQQLTVLKDQIIRIKQNREAKPASSLQQQCCQYKQTIHQLNINLQQQINQNNQLSEAIVRYMQKQTKMKETLSVLQKQSKQIFSLVQQKQLNEQSYQKAIDELQAELAHLKDQQQSARATQISKEELEQKMESHVNQSHNEELLKLQEKLLSQNNQLAVTCNHLREENAKLNDELMLICIQNNDQKTKLEAEGIRLKDEYKNQQEAHLNKIKDLQRSIKNKEIEVEIWKSRYSDKQSQQRGYLSQISKYQEQIGKYQAQIGKYQAQLSKYQSQIGKYEAQIGNYQMEIGQLRISLQQSQQDKFNLQSSNHQKDIQILQLTEQVSAMILLTTSSIKPQPNTTHLNLISDLKERLLNKNWNSDWDSLLQSVLDKSVLGEQISKLLNLQQKGRLLSKQLQKMKASLLKSDWRNQQQKIATMGLFKKCDIIVSQLISCAQSLNQNQSSFL